MYETAWLIQKIIWPSWNSGIWGIDEHYWSLENVPESETNEFKQEHVKLETATGREIHSHSHPQTTDPTRMQCMVAVGWFIHGSHTSPVWLLATSCHKKSHRVWLAIAQQRVSKSGWVALAACLPGRSTKPPPSWPPPPISIWHRAHGHRACLS